MCSATESVSNFEIQHRSSRTGRGDEIVVVTQSAFPGSVCLPLPEVAQTKVEVKQAHCIDPLLDARWDSFLESHPRASVFHSTAWLSALSRTYGYKPVVFTTAPAGENLE